MSRRSRRATRRDERCGGRGGEATEAARPPRQPRRRSPLRLLRWRCCCPRRRPRNTRPPAAAAVRPSPGGRHRSCVRSASGLSARRRRRAARASAPGVVIVAAKRRAARRRGGCGHLRRAVGLVHRSRRLVYRRADADAAADALRIGGVRAAGQAARSRHAALRGRRPGAGVRELPIRAGARELPVSARMSVRLVELLGPPPPAASPHVEAIEPRRLPAARRPHLRLFGCSVFGSRRLHLAMSRPWGYLAKRLCFLWFVYLLCVLGKRLGCFQLKHTCKSPTNACL